MADILDDSEQRIVVVVPGDLNEVKKEKKIPIISGCYNFFA